VIGGGVVIGTENLQLQEEIADVAPAEIDAVI
jgi:hypothetical protein